MEKLFVPYYRVSTKKQGLGLEAQKAMVEEYIKRKNGTALAAFQEKASATAAKDHMRTELPKALALCKEKNATLIVAKLDRLSRSVYFMAQLQDSGINFVFVDFPEASRLTISFMAALAEHEALQVSERTKAALKVKKEQGCKLGNPGNLSYQAQVRGAASRREKAMNDPNTKKIMAVITNMGKNGAPLSQMAEELNNSGFLTTSGSKFSPALVGYYRGKYA